MSNVVALQRALANEHAIVYGYGVVAARLSGEVRRQALARLAAHEAWRDQLAALVQADGITPVAAQPAYALPFPVTSRTAAVDLAVHLEDAAAGSAYDVVADSVAASAARGAGVTLLSDAAGACARWHALAGTEPPALPGQPSSQPSMTPTSSPS